MANGMARFFYEESAGVPADAWYNLVNSARVTGTGHLHVGVDWGRQVPALFRFPRHRKSKGWRRHVRRMKASGQIERKQRVVEFDWRTIRTEIVGM